MKCFISILFAAAILNGCLATAINVEAPLDLLVPFNDLLPPLQENVETTTTKSALQKATTIRDESIKTKATTTTAATTDIPIALPVLSLEPLLPPIEAVADEKQPISTVEIATTTTTTTRAAATTTKPKTTTTTTRTRTTTTAIPIPVLPVLSLEPLLPPIEAIVQEEQQPTTTTTDEKPISKTTTAAKTTTKKTYEITPTRSAFTLRTNIATAAAAAASSRNIARQQQQQQQQLAATATNIYKTQEIKPTKKSYYQQQQKQQKQQQQFLHKQLQQQHAAATTIQLQHYRPAAFVTRPPKGALPTITPFPRVLKRST